MRRAFDDLDRWAARHLAGSLPPQCVPALERHRDLLLQVYDRMREAELAPDLLGAVRLRYWAAHYVRLCWLIWRADLVW